MKAFVFSSWVGTLVQLSFINCYYRTAHLSLSESNRTNRTYRTYTITYSNRTYTIFDGISILKKLLEKKNLFVMVTKKTEKCCDYF